MFHQMRVWFALVRRVKWRCDPLQPDMIQPCPCRQPCSCILRVAGVFAAISMPGMMDTVLNLGLNDEVVEGLAKKSGGRFAYDSYRRFLDMFGT